MGDNTHPLPYIAAVALSPCCACIAACVQKHAIPKSFFSTKELSAFFFACIIYSISLLLFFNKSQVSVFQEHPKLFSNASHFFFAFCFKNYVWFKLIFSMQRSHRRNLKCTYVQSMHTKIWNLKSEQAVKALKKQPSFISLFISVIE